MINLNNIRFFYSVADNLSFTRVASDLCVTQSAVIKRVRRIEEEVGLKLFIKHKGKARLTEEGKILFEQEKKSSTMKRGLKKRSTMSKN